MFEQAPGWNSPEQARSFQGAIPAQINYVWIREGLVSNSYFNQAPDALKPSDLEPPPTCPFI
jgi:hypothetical protein